MKDFIIKYWIEFLFSGGLFVLGFIARTTYSKVKRLSLFEQGLQALLKDRILQAYNLNIERAYCPIYSLECVCDMYEQYHALGGNGTITKLVNELKQLPTSPHDVYNYQKEELYDEFS